MNNIKTFFGIDMNTAIWCRSLEEAYYFFQIVSHYGLKWQNDVPFEIDDYKRWNNVMCCYALRGSFGRTREYNLLMTYTDFYKRIESELEAEGFELAPFVREPESETNLAHFIPNIAQLIIQSPAETILDCDFPSKVITMKAKEILEWLIEEYQEEIYLTDREKGFIYYCGKVGFISRDANGELNWFDTEPNYESNYWDVRYEPDGYFFKIIEEDLFKFIKPGQKMSVQNIFHNYMKGEQI